MNKFLDDVLKPLIHDAITSVVSLLVPMITAEIIKQLGTHDEVLTAKQLHDKVFICYKDIQTTRDNFLNRKDFPKIVRNGKTVYSLRAVNEYLQNTK